MTTRAIEEVPPLERIEQPANLGVSERNLADVQVVAVGRGEGLRRIVRAMRIVKMRPQEEA